MGQANYEYDEDLDGYMAAGSRPQAAPAQPHPLLARYFQIHRQVIRDAHKHRYPKGPIR
jgi:hypothetical protein